MEDGSSANPTTAAAAPPTDTPELVGFIVSIIGIAMCGLLAPIGMLLSLAEMRRRPNGFAKAGFVIGLIGTILLVGGGIVFAIAMVQVRAQYQQVYRLMDQMEQSIEARKLVEDFAVKHKRLPSPKEARTLFTQLGDEGQSFSFQPGEGGSFTITDRGPDGQWGTHDDGETPGYAPLRQ